MSADLISWIIMGVLSLAGAGFVWRVIAKRDERIREEGAAKVVKRVREKAEQAQANIDKVQAERRDEKQTMGRLDDGTF